MNNMDSAIPQARASNGSPKGISTAVVSRPTARPTVALTAYVGACLLTGTVGDSVELESLVVRLITLASMGGLATYFWRIERDRRRSSIDQTAMPQLQLGR